MTPRPAIRSDQIRNTPIRGHTSAREWVGAGGSVPGGMHVGVRVGVGLLVGVNVMVLVGVDVMPSDIEMRVGCHFVVDSARSVGDLFIKWDSEQNLGRTR